MEARIHPDGQGLLVKTRDADRFYLLLNRIAQDGINIESVAPADDDVLSVYEYLIGAEEPPNELQRLPWALWRAQILAILRLELKKTFFTRRGPGFTSWRSRPCCSTPSTRFVQSEEGRARRPGRGYATFSLPYSSSSFSGWPSSSVAWGFSGNLFRGEVLEKSLHYYFLAPLRREVLVVGKFLSGLLVAAWSSSAPAPSCSFCPVLVLSARTPSRSTFSTSMASRTWRHYLGVTLLACVGYGSVFLAAGLLFRNPLIPTVVVLVWEAVNGFLPAVLQQISVIFYLKSLCPVSRAGSDLHRPRQPAGFPCR